MDDGRVSRAQSARHAADSRPFGPATGRPSAGMTERPYRAGPETVLELAALPERAQLPQRANLDKCFRLKIRQPENKGPSAD